MTHPVKLGPVSTEVQVSVKAQLQDCQIEQQGFISNKITLHCK